MTLRKSETTRRSFLKTLAVVPVAAVAAFSGRVMAALVTTDDPMAKSLQYTPNSDKPDQNCANCALYLGGDAAQGACPLFPGKEVVSTGWCASWAPKT
jgi:hypothetical protein